MVFDTLKRSRFPEKPIFLVVFLSHPPSLLCLLRPCKEAEEDRERKERMRVEKSDGGGDEKEANRYRERGDR